jgi:hypothetical protein
VTGRAASPDKEYSQMSPWSLPILLALGAGDWATELAGGSAAGSGLGS